MAAIEPAVHLLKAPPPGCESVLSGDAIAFLTMLARRFEPTRQELLERRRQRQLEIDAGRLPDFLSETRDIRERDWTVAAIRPDLLERRVEITGPVDRKMMINAFNSGANVFMADFEDSNAPTWENNLVGQQNLRDAVAGTIGYVSPEGKRYALNPHTATLIVRPRGWHLVEKHMVVDGRPISAALFDFGLAFFHNAAALIAKGTGPYFYLPKLESHLEARLWNDVFNAAQDALGIGRGTIRATVLIETIHPALVPVAREVFDAHMRGPHQIHVKRDDVRVTARDLLTAPGGAITEEGLRKNIDVALRYLAAWLAGTGCVPIYDLMEDAATAEISRAQVWQWLRHGARMESGRPVTAALVQQTLSELVESLPERVGAEGPGMTHFSLAGRILSELATGPEFAEFLTTVAYEYLD